MDLCIQIYINVLFYVYSSLIFFRHEALFYIVYNVINIFVRRLASLYRLRERGIKTIPYILAWTRDEK